MTEKSDRQRRISAFDVRGHKVHIVDERTRTAIVKIAEVGFVEYAFAVTAVVV